MGGIVKLCNRRVTQPQPSVPDVHNSKLDLIRLGYGCPGERNDVSTT